MKIKGITLPQLLETLLEVSGVKVAAKFKTADNGTLDGYFQVQGFGGDDAFKTVKVGGGSHYGPCAHFYVSLIKRLKKNYPGVSFTIWLHKHALTTYTYNVQWKAETALAKKGFKCAHGTANDQIQAYVNATQTPSAPPSAPQTPTGHIFEHAPVVGDPVTGGESKSINDVKGHTRPVYAVVASLYVLEEMKIAALRIPPRVTPDIPDHLVTRALHAVTWRARVLREADQFAERLARQFFDFCVVACFGEARYGQAGKYTFDVPGMKESRSGAYQIALKYDPRDLLPKLMHVFNDFSWGGSIGGKKWGNIARAATLYFKYRNAPIVFVDHCVDLAHNGGLAFNKGYILTNPSDKDAYMTMLDEKRHGSLFDSKRSHPITPAVYALLSEGIGLGVMRRPRTPFDVKDDVPVPTLKWGSATITLYDGVKETPAPVPSAQTLTPIPTEAPTHGPETYPSR